MTDPVTLTAGAIATLAFQEFVKSGAGELAKKSVGSTIDLVKSLRDKIRAKFQGDSKAEKALSAIEQSGDEAALTKLEVYLDDAMAEDETFAAELRQVAQQIVNIQTQNQSTREYNNYGRDQFNIESMQGNQRLGGS